MVMVEQSLYFDWCRVPEFFENWNINFRVSQMNGSIKNYILVLASDCFDNIEDNLSNGVLNSNVTTFASADCILKWHDEIISLGDDVVFDLDTDVVYPLKGIFLLDKSTSFVIGYCINVVPFNVANQVVFDEGLIFFSIRDGEVDGE